MKRLLRYIFLVLAWLFAGVVALLLVAVLLIQTGPVKRKIVQIAETQVSKTLKGRLSIGNLEGDFFTKLKLENVCWTVEKDTFLFVESVSASYRLLPLLHGELLLNSVQLTKPYVRLKQEVDSTWNFQRLVPETSSNEVDTSSASGNFQIILSDFELAEGKLRIQALDSLIPREVNDLNVNMALKYATEKQELRLKKLAFQTLQPDFQLAELSLDVVRDQEAVSLRNFHVKTARNALKGEANYSDVSSLNVAAKLESEPVNLDEFEFFIPAIKLSAKPVVNFSSKIVEGELEASLAVNDKEQGLQLDLFSENFGQFLADPQFAGLKYRLTGDIRNVSLAYWLGDPQLSYLLNGRLNLDGEGTDPKTARLNLDADFSNCLFAGKPVEELKMTLWLDKGNLLGDITGEGNFGFVSLVPEIKNWQGNPEYRLRALTRNLNLAPLLGNDSLQSDINLKAQMAGNGFDPAALTASANIVVAESEFAGFVLDSLVGNFRYAQKNIGIDSLWAQAQALRVNASGNYSLEDHSDIRVEAVVDSIQPFWAYLPVDSLYGKGKVEAHVWGTPDSLLLNSLAELEEIAFSGLTVKKLAIKADGRVTLTDTIFAAQLMATQSGTADFMLDTVNAAAEYRTDSVWLTAQLAGEQLKSALSTRVLLGDTMRVELSDWSLDFMNQHLELVNAPAWFEMDSLGYRLQNFKMASDASDTSQFIKAEGTVSLKGEEDFKLEIAHVDIGQLLESLGQKADVFGKVNASIALTGTAANPALNGDFSIDNALAYGYRFSALGGGFGLENQRFQFQGQAIPADSGSITLNAAMPVNARLDSMEFEVDPKDTVNALLRVDRFPLASLPFLKAGEQIKGEMNGEVAVGGTLESSDPKGSLKLLDAAVIMPEYGINYRDIVFELNFSEKAARLDSFFIKSPDGVLQASGAVDFQSAFYKGGIQKSEVSIQFKRFNPFSHRHYNMQLSGDVNLKGEAGDVVFWGDLKVPKAEIYLPAVMNLMGKISAPEIPDPILLREIEKLSQSADSLSMPGLDLVATVKDTINLNYFDNFTGKLNIEFPQNTWIKNKDMFVEISGDLDVVKNNEYFELFGKIDVVRGQYDLFGKIFKIDEGSATFLGGEEMIPMLNVKASYTFRNSDRAEQKLSVAISGKASEPTIQFLLDDGSISEGDALSYLIFGKGVNELSVAQQDNVPGAGQLAGSAAMAVLSSQLTDLLGRSLNVDYIEVKGYGDFENSGFVVGKYITNDLFVSYEQRFGETDEKDIAKYEVKLEYELFRFLFLQLNNSSTDSGFDLILKLNSK